MKLVSLLIICFFASQAYSNESIDIDQKEVRDPKGCLNLQKLVERVRGFPDDVVIREATTDFRISSKKGSGGKTPSEDLIRLLSGANYQMAERVSQDYKNSLPEVRQEGCKSVFIKDGENGEAEMKIIKAKRNQLTLQSSTETRYIELKNKREWFVRSSYRALDYCSEGSKYEVQRTVLTRWGPAIDIEETGEKIRKGFLVRLSEAFRDFPGELQELIKKSGKKSEVGLARPQLQQLATLEVHPELRRCPDPEPTPAPDEHQPSPTPAASPSNGFR